MLSGLQFESFADFIQMGRHGFYVWAAYGVFLGILLFNILSPLQRRKRFINQHQKRLRREKLRHESQT